MQQNQTPQKRKSTIPYQLLIGALVILIYFAVVVYNRRAGDSGTNVVANQNTNSETIPEDGSNSSPYKNGTYTAVGNYVSPGGREEFSVTLTLANGVINDSSVVVESGIPTSVQFQTEFASNYKQFVIGKSIEDLKLTKVAGSSLTPIGFNDAVAKIKAQAAL